MAAPKKNEPVVIDVKTPNIQEVVVRIVGTAPFVSNKFSKKAKEKMMADMSRPRAERKTKGRSEREPRNYEAEYKQAQHIAPEGWPGIPCSAFRSAMIDACRTAGMVMTHAKLAVFVTPDGFDADEGTPLVRLHSEGAPERMESLVRNDNGGADIRIRALWRSWWCDVRLTFDGDMITAESVVNLLHRAGLQVGVGEGRPFSKYSTGLGLGTFRIAEAVERTGQGAA